MVHRRNWVILAAVVFTLIALIPATQAEPPAIAGNPGLPGYIAEVNRLGQMIADQNTTIEELNVQINTLQALLDAMKNYAPVPQTGQTASYSSGDDGHLQMGVLWPIPRFTDNGNGTVTDNLTGLIWLQNANCFGPQTWADALTESNNLQHGNCGLTDNSLPGDWRLPNIKELHSLIHYGVHDPALPNANGTGKWAEGDSFTGVVNDRYWSSTTVAGSGEEYYLYLGGGFVGQTPKTHYGYYVWPVRDPQ